MRSIRFDLTARLLAGLGLTIVAVGGASTLLVRRAVSADFDAALAGKARALGGLIAFDETGGFELELTERAAREYRDRTDAERPPPVPDLDPAPGPAPVAAPIGASPAAVERPVRADAEFMNMWIEGGELVARSPSLRGTDLPQRCGPLDVPVFWDHDLGGGRVVRAVGLLVQPEWDDDSAPAAAAQPPRVVVVTARSRAPLDATLTGVSAIFAVGCVATLLVIAAMVPSSVRRALRPLQRLSQRVDAIDAATLSRRLEVDGVPRELGFIPPKLNALLQRIEEAFERERRMTGNLAHELRTPLAELRTAAEVARRWPDDSELRERAIAAAHDVSVRMGSLVDALLRLARIASGEARLELDRVSIAPAIQESWKGVAAGARERRQPLELDLPADVAVTTDRELLAVAVGNLLVNAVQHGAPDRPIRCFAGARDGGVRVTVANGANGLRPEDLPHLAEPFWRADAARAGHRGTGLGLALVDDVADALGARLSFELEGGEFRAHLDLPNGHAPAT